MGNQWGFVGRGLGNKIQGRRVTFLQQKHFEAAPNDKNKGVLLFFEILTHKTLSHQPYTNKNNKNNKHNSNKNNANTNNKHNTDSQF